MPLLLTILPHGSLKDPWLCTPRLVLRPHPEQPADEKPPGFQWTEAKSADRGRKAFHKLLIVSSFVSSFVKWTLKVTQCISLFISVTSCWVRSKWGQYWHDLTAKNLFRYDPEERHWTRYYRPGLYRALNDFHFKVDVHKKPLIAN